MRGHRYSNKGETCLGRGVRAPPNPPTPPVHPGRRKVPLSLHFPLPSPDLQPPLLVIKRPRRTLTMEEIMRKRREEAAAAYDAQWNDGRGSHHPDYDPLVIGDKANKATRCVHIHARTDNLVTIQKQKKEKSGSDTMIKAQRVRDMFV